MKSFRNSNLEACPNACVVGTWRWERSHGDSHLEGDVFCMGTFRITLYLTIIYLCNYSHKKACQSSYSWSIIPFKSNQQIQCSWMNEDKTIPRMTFGTFFAFCNSNFVCNSKIQTVKTCLDFCSVFRWPLSGTRT